MTALAGLGRALAAQLAGANPSRGGDGAAGPVPSPSAPSPAEPPRPGFVPDPPRPPAQSLAAFPMPKEPVLSHWPCGERGHVFDDERICDYCSAVER